MVAIIVVMSGNAGMIAAVLDYEGDLRHMRLTSHMYEDTLTYI